MKWLAIFSISLIFLSSAANSQCSDFVEAPLQEEVLAGRPPLTGQALRSVLSQKISDLGMYHAFVRRVANNEFGLTYIGDLIAFTPKQLLRIPGFGKGSLRALEQALATRGVYFDMETPGWPYWNLQR
jgi:DNA-directed RNA polymerase alpha subunit